MTKRFAVAKRVFLGLALIVALAAAPAAMAAGSLVDDGSAYWTARVRGYGFTPSSWAFVEVYNAADGAYVDNGWVQTSPTFCWLLCFGGGEFSQHVYMDGHQCTTRNARAYDWGTRDWSDWIQLMCS